MAFGADSGALFDELEDIGGDVAGVEDGGFEAAVVFFDALAEFAATGLVLVVQGLDLLEGLGSEAEFGCQPREFRGGGVTGALGLVMGVWVRFGMGW